MIGSGPTCVEARSYDIDTDIVCSVLQFLVGPFNGKVGCSTVSVGRASPTPTSESKMAASLKLLN